MSSRTSKHRSDKTSTRDSKKNGLFRPMKGPTICSAELDVPELTMSKLETMYGANKPASLINDTL